MSSLAFPKPIKELPNPRQKIAARSDKGRLVALADRLVAGLVMARAGNRCEVCGCRATATNPLDPAHVFAKKAHPSVRFDGRNVIAACRFDHQEGHRDPGFWSRVTLRILGSADYTGLARASVLPMTYTVDEVIAAAKAGRFIQERTQ